MSIKILISPEIGDQRTALIRVTKTCQSVEANKQLSETPAGKHDRHVYYHHLASCWAIIDACTINLYMFGVVNLSSGNGPIPLWGKVVNEMDGVKFSDS